MKRLLAIVAVVVLAAAACDGGDDETAEPVFDDPPEVIPVDAGVLTCTNEDFGYAAVYPEDWYSNPGNARTVCTLFATEPYEVLDKAEDPIWIDISFTRVATDIDDASTNEEIGLQERLNEDAEVAGRPAVRTELVADGLGLDREGTVIYRWYVDAGDGTIVATAKARQDDAEYQENKRVLDAMMADLRLFPPGPATALSRADQVVIVEQSPGSALPFDVVVFPSQGESWCFEMKAATATASDACDNVVPPAEPLTFEALEVGATSTGVGLTSPEVVRVESVSVDGTNVDATIVSVNEEGSKAYATRMEPDGIVRVVAYGADGGVVAGIETDGS